MHSFLFLFCFLIIYILDIRVAFSPHVHELRILPLSFTRAYTLIVHSELENENNSAFSIFYPSFLFFSEEIG
jgi:hypothetical protein